MTGGRAPGILATSTRHPETALITQTLPRPGEWTESALCAQADPDAWFPDRGRIAAAARRICGTCPVRAQCLDYALPVTSLRPPGRAGGRSVTAVRIPAQMTSPAER